MKTLILLVMLLLPVSAHAKGFGNAVVGGAVGGAVAGALISNKGAPYGNVTGYSYDPRVTIMCDTYNQLTMICGYSKYKQNGYAKIGNQHILGLAMKKLGFKHPIVINIHTAFYGENQYIRAVYVTFEERKD